MKKKRALLILLLIFIIAFSSRLFIAYQSDTVSYDGFSSLKHIQNINKEGVPLFEDELSFSGRDHLFPPVFYYMVSFFSFLGTVHAAKILPNLFFALLVVPVYLLSFNITKKRVIALITAFFSGFIPIFFVPVNDVSAYSLVSLLFLFIIYFFSYLKDKSSVNMLLFLLVALVFSHASVFVLVIGFLIYLILLRVEGFESNPAEQEVIIFLSFLSLWFYFLVYKDAILMHGSLILWQNIPVQLLSNQFVSINVLQGIYLLGVLPLIFGIYSIYTTFFDSKKRPLVLVVSQFFSVLILFWLRLISFEVGFLFLALFLVILSSHSLNLFYKYLKKTKIPSVSRWFFLGVLLFFILTSLVPSINIGTSHSSIVPSSEEIEAMQWLKNNTKNNSIILATPQEGFMINYLAQRKNVIDMDFLMIPDAQQRYDDVRDIFSLRLKTSVVRKLGRYGVDYIYFSGKFTESDQLYYIDDDCFKKVYDQGVQIYNVRCSI